MQLEAEEGTYAEVLALPVAKCSLNSMWIVDERHEIANADTGHTTIQILISAERNIEKVGCARICDCMSVGHKRTPETERPSSDELCMENCFRFFFWINDMTRCGGLSEFYLEIAVIFYSLSVDSKLQDMNVVLQRSCHNYTFHVVDTNVIAGNA